MSSSTSSTFAPLRRSFGLDVLRATAIATVVVGHSWRWTGPPTMLTRLTPTIDGVELFFVLSGFLIGRIVLAGTQHGANTVWLLDFWQRRWLRTLPLYFFMFGVNVLLVLLNWTQGTVDATALRCLVFAQNLWMPWDRFFLESWSLSVEEWFYLLFPLLLLAALRILGKRRDLAYLLVAASMVCLVVGCRWVLWSTQVPPSGPMPDLALTVVARADAIAIGAIVSWPWFRYSGLLIRWRWFLLALGISGLFWSGSTRAAFIRDHGVWFFSASAATSAMVLPFLANWARAGRWGDPVVFISRHAYALYLVHLPVRNVLMTFGVDDTLPSGVFLLLYWSLCLLGAWVLRSMVEAPIMNLRDNVGRWLRKRAEVRMGR